MQRAPRHLVVIAGGSGSRFWPRSRERVPKQLLAIAGTRSLLADTLARVRGLAPRGNLHVVTVQTHAEAVRRVARGVASGNVHVEPRARNTAAAVALAALRLAERDPRALMLVLPADHAVPDGVAFRRTMACALEVAHRTDALVTIGIEPTRPETGFGYIEIGTRLPGAGGRAFGVRRFLEKPDRPTAERLLARGGVLWNGGIFAWSVARILAELRCHLPEVVGPIDLAIRRGTQRALARAYGAIPSVSIDTGVLERARNVAVVRAGFAWSDVGSWAAVADLWRRTGDGNAERGVVVSVDSEGCVIDAQDRLVAVLGVRDLVVVQTADAVLVCPKSRAQDVRLVVDELRRRRLMRYL